MASPHSPRRRRGREGKNLLIQFRWANNNYDLLPGLAEDLVRAKVHVLAEMAKRLEPARFELVVNRATERADRVIE